MSMFSAASLQASSNATRVSFESINDAKVDLKAVLSRHGDILSVEDQIKAMKTLKSSNMVLEVEKKYNIESQAVAVFNAAYGDPTPPVTDGCELAQMLQELSAQDASLADTSYTFKRDE